MTKKPKTGPDYTRAETYMRPQTPSIPDRSRLEAEDHAKHAAIDTTDHSQNRRKAFGIAAVLLLASALMIFLSDRFGPVVDGIAGVFAAFAIAVSIHILRPRPMLRFLLVVIALASLAVTFATVLRLHLYGAA